MPLQALLARNDGSPLGTILIVDDDPAVVQVFGHILASLGAVRFALSGAEGLRLAREWPVDLVLLDLNLPDISGIEVCRQMKADPNLTDVPVVCITSHTEVEHELEALEAGAVDFIGKPPRPLLLQARVRTHLRLKHLTDALRHSAHVDGLTGVANRQRLDDLLLTEWLRATRSASPLSMLMVDVDHFKRYNDQYGHPAGDQCLRAVARALRDTVQRPADRVARYGGEEFVLLLPDTDLGGASRMAERVLQAVAALGLPHADSPTAPHVTVSIGAACAYPVPSTEGTEGDAASRGPAMLLAQADRELYAAKAAGRACCKAAQPTASLHALRG